VFGIDNASCKLALRRRKSKPFSVAISAILLAIAAGPKSHVCTSMRFVDPLHDVAYHDNTSMRMAS
jgi:hypothetical protein